jgi:hypothetical protein
MRLWHSLERSVDESAAQGSTNVSILKTHWKYDEERGRTIEWIFGKSCTVEETENIEGFKAVWTFAKIAGELKPQGSLRCRKNHFNLRKIKS